MTDVPFYAPGHDNSPRPAPAKPRPGEPLWSLRKGGRQIDAELRYHGEYGVEAQIFSDRELLIGRRFDTRELAVQWAEEERKAFGAGTGA